MQSLSRLKNPYNINPLKGKPLKSFFQGLSFWLCAPFLLSCSSTQIFAQGKTGHAYNYSILPQSEEFESIDQFMQIKILGSIALKPIKIDSLVVSELSGIAWDNDEQLLYAISDEGLLYHIKLIFNKGRLHNMRVILAVPLKSKKGKPLKGKRSDSEGLTLINGNNGIQGDAKLVISFENKPRVALFTPKGEFIKKIRLPRKLEKRKSYRNKNKALESVTSHPKYGFLTASEYPLDEDSLNYQSLYSASGKTWHFSASQATNSAITGLETLPNGDIMILERAYKNPVTPIRINLRRLNLEQCNQKNECKTEIIASFDGSDGWLLDNFEGLAHIHKNQYLMVSDDNQNLLQKTIFVHFEVLSN